MVWSEVSVHVTRWERSTILKQVALKYAHFKQSPVKAVKIVKNQKKAEKAVAPMPDRMFQFGDLESKECLLGPLG